MVSHTKGIIISSPAPGTAFQGHRFELAIGIITPLVIDAVEALFAAKSLAQHQRPAVGTAVDQDMDASFAVARQNDWDFTDMRGFIIPFVGDLSL